MNPVFSKNSNAESQCGALKELMELKRNRNDEYNLLLEFKNTLRRSMLSPKNILSNMDLYYKREELLDDEEVDENYLFTIDEIQKICVLYRLHFVDAIYFKNQIPSVAEIKLEYLNDTYRKKLNGLKILSYRENFLNPSQVDNYGMLFAPTLNGHYYLIHQWGKPISKKRKWQYFPLRSFETLAISVMLFTLIVDLILPTHLITLDRTATYWSGYRLGVYFHLLIFFGGLSMFFVVGFFKNVSKNIWDSV